MVFTSHAEAKAAAEAAGLSVLGFAQENRDPGYILVDPDADPLACRNAAFEALRGRPLDPREEMLLSMVEARSAQD